MILRWWVPLALVAWSFVVALPAPAAHRDDALRLRDVYHGAYVYGRRDVHNDVALGFSLSHCRLPRPDRGSCAIEERGVDIGDGDRSWSVDHSLIVTPAGPRRVRVKSRLFGGEDPLFVARPR
jgi:hypothetical protein